MISNSYFKRFLRTFFSKPLGVIGLALLCLIIFLSIFGPYLTPYTSYQIHLSHKNVDPNSMFWFGTDELGRDLFTRCWYGARISLLVAFIAAVIDVIFGVFWGAFSAFVGGKADDIMMRICDIISSVPYLLMVILLIVVIGPGLVSIILALSCVGWINMARITRAKVLEIKGLDYVLASVAFGATRKQIIKSHLVPNAIGPVIATMMLTIPSAIFAEAFLSFLGLGIQLPLASLGSMANDGLGALRYFAWRCFFPASIICLIMLAFNLVGNSLREALDPRLED